MMTKEYRELAQTIANQALALAEGRIEPSLHYMHVKRLENNTATLLAWTAKP